MADYVPRPGYFGLKDPRRHLDKDIQSETFPLSIVIFRKSTFE